MNSMSGEVIVAGLVTGTHLIEDIGVAVPHQIAVHIPADQALRSKDLWRGIQQGKLFKLDGGSGFHVGSARTAEASRLANLESENHRLTLELAEARRELEAERNRNHGLVDVLAGLQAQLQGVQAAVGRLGDASRDVHNTQVGPGAPSVAAPNGAVGGEAPTFLPDRIRPEAAVAQIRPATETTESSNVANAASKLREMRKQPG